MNTELIAMVCHEANRAYCAAIGDHSQRSWSEAEEWQRSSAVAGVRFRLENPDAGAAAQHDAWVATKDAEGWTYGPIKDPATKQHPCMVPYCDLPVEQQAKDEIFAAVVDAMKPLLSPLDAHRA